MFNFEFYAPTRVVFGRGTEARTGRLLKEFGAATGENAAVVNCRAADVIVAPIGAVIADAPGRQ